LWVLDVASGEERLVVDPSALLADPGDLPEAEARRRERAREMAGGVVSYALDKSAERASFALGGHLFVVDLTKGRSAEVKTEPGVFDPRIDPKGDVVAYVAGPTLRLAGPRHADHLLAGEDDPEVSWGSAEFVAAEEMGRSRGFWWSDDGASLAVARVDNHRVHRWYVADAANPSEPPATLRYPAAGTENASVGLYLVDREGRSRKVAWDHEALPYLANVNWGEGQPLTLTVQSRDQRSLRVLVADPLTGETEERWRQDDEHWVELTPGAPRWWGNQLVALVDRDRARRVVVEGTPITPTDLQVRAVVGTLGEDLVVTGSEEPTETHVYRLSRDGRLLRLTHEPGVHTAMAAGDVAVISSTSMSWAGARVSVLRGDEKVAEVASLAAKPGLAPKGRFWTVGSRRLRTVVLQPRAGDAGSGGPERGGSGRTGASSSSVDGPLPVLLDPYGGPHAQRVTRSRNALLTSQWFADQGFIVVVTDGRGTPGRGPEWERAVWGDLAGPVLDDQVDALLALAGRDERLDLTRVGIRGWSFGGYLAALAVLRRPDIFHAAVAGAPVTEWRLYDTHYTERYLGHPATNPEHYDRTSLVLDAGRLTRPLMLIHGLADDNVVSAHTFQLSSELLAHGRPHQVLPLSGVTHMTPQEVVAENLLLLQVEFLRRALGE
jgi:dipeptidyl-peptidase-4